MSLDVMLINDVNIKKNTSGIFIREKGQTVEISIEEWNKRRPNIEPVRMPEEDYETKQVYSANITHNLNKMADEAGIYEHLWCPEEIEITVAIQLIEPLSMGLQLLISEPDRFKVLNPDNGWGAYDGLVKFVENYLIACIKYPDSKIEVNR